MTIVAIQGLRAGAAAMVVVHHARHELGALGGAGDGAAWLPWWAGVDVFFVISGFIIVTAAGSLGARPGRLAFLAHRIARVVPLYWLATLLFLGATLALPAAVSAPDLVRDPAYVAASLLFWPAARPDGVVQPLYGLGWTLNYEMAFYGLFALAMGWGQRAAAIGVALLLGLVVLAGAVLHPPLPLAFWADPIVLEFALGAGLALARAEGLRLGRPARLALAAGGLAGLAAAQAFGVADAGGLRPLAYGLPALLLVAAAGLADAGPAGGPATRALWAVGDASYALYLVHPFVLRAARAGLTRIGADVPAPLWVAGVLGLCVAAALLVHRGVERPLTDRLRRILASPRSAEQRVSTGRGRVPGPADPP